MTKEETDTWSIKDVADVLEKHGLMEIQEPKLGRWVRISPAEIYECSECGQNIMTSDICAYKFCHGCGIKMQEEE